MGQEAVPAEPTRLQTVTREDFSAFVNANLLTPLRARKIGGAVVVAVRDGTELYRGQLGYANIEKRIPVDVGRTMFTLASVSKTFTATAVAQLVASGRLSYEDNVNQRLSSLQLRESFTPPITVANLLTHSTGIPDLFIGASCDGATTCLVLHDLLSQRQPQQLAPPGLFLSYSNFSNAVAGQLVADTTHMKYGEYLRTHIFQPLGMRATRYDVPGEPGAEDAAAIAAVTYEIDTDDRLIRSPPYYSMFYPAGQIQSSGADMEKYLIAQLGNNETLLPAATRLEMQHVHAVGSSPNAGFGWSWGIEQLRDGVTVISHGGDLRGVVCDLQMIPHANFGYFVAVTGDAGATLDEFAQALYREFLPAPSAAANKQPSSTSDAVRGDLVGVYQDFRFANFDPLVMLSVFSEASIQQIDTRHIQLHVPMLLGGETYTFEAQGRDRLVGTGSVAQSQLHNTPILRALRDARGHVQFVTSNLPNGYQLAAAPLAPIRQTRFKIPLLIVLVAGLLAVTAWTAFRVCRPERPHRAGRGASLLLGLAALSAAVFPIVAAWRFLSVSHWELLYGLRHMGLAVVYGLPWIALALLVGATFTGVVGSIQSRWVLRERILYGVAVLVGWIYLGLLAENGQFLTHIY